MKIDPEQIEIRYLQAFADFKDAHILEIGCGDGRLTWRYAEHSCRVTAIDPDPDRLESALQACPPALRSTVAFTCSRAEALPFPAQTFDGTILSWSL